MILQKISGSKTRTTFVVGLTQLMENTARRQGRIQIRATKHRWLVISRLTLGRGITSYPRLASEVFWKLGKFPCSNLLSYCLDLDHFIHVLASFSAGFYSCLCMSMHVYACLCMWPCFFSSLDYALYSSFPAQAEFSRPLGTMSVVMLLDISLKESDQLRLDLQSTDTGGGIRELM